MKIYSKFTLALLTCSFGIMSVRAQEADQKNMYFFPRPDTPVRISPYSNTIYSASHNTMRTVKGDILRDAKKDTIMNFEVSPTGVSYVMVEKGKKPQNTISLYETGTPDSKITNFNIKKYGNPIDAVFTPEGRTLIVATTDSLFVVENRKMIPVDRINDYPVKPGKMIVSPNGYYLVIANGNKAVVYNLEEKKIRTTLDVGENINDLAFSPDNSDLAILTDDGVLNIYNTRNYELRKMIDDLGEGRAFAYNLDGKYVGVVVDPSNIQVVNLLQDADRYKYYIEVGCVNDIVLIPDASNNTIMTFTAQKALDAIRLPFLKPYYAKLIDEEVNSMMDEWLKMMPGETMEQYRERVTAEGQARQRSEFEFEITTRLAGNILKDAKLTLGSYDRPNQILEVFVESMPTIYLPVPEEDLTAFTNADDLSLSEVLFGITPDDNFEIVYAKVKNSNNGKSYVFDNRSRSSMNYLSSDEKISLDVLQKQQMEEIRLRELSEKKVQEAKDQKIISNHTNITVSSRIQPDYDANGNQILNYIVKFTYDVSPGFSAMEDFAGGKYHIDESGAATSMLNIVKEAFQGDFKKYLDDSKKLNVTIMGTADASPIVTKIPYDGSFGDYEQEPVYVDGQLSALTVKKSDPIKTNQQLAFLRALAVKDFLENNVEKYNDIAKDYRYEVNVSKERGSQFRRIVAEFTFVDAFKN